MMDEKPDTTETRIPIVEERPIIAIREDRKSVRVKTRLAEHDEWVEQELRHEDVLVERVPVDRFVESAPEVRQEGDRTIVPLVEEVLVIEKRLLLREELHIIKQVSFETEREKVTLRRTEATVERSDER